VHANEFEKDTDETGNSPLVVEAFTTALISCCRTLHSGNDQDIPMVDANFKSKDSGGPLGKAASKIDCRRYDTTSGFVNPLQGPKLPSTPYCVKGDFDNLAKPSRFPSTSQY
jgi:hypothetical protein